MGCDVQAKQELQTVWGKQSFLKEDLMILCRWEGGKEGGGGTEDSSGCKMKMLGGLKEYSDNSHHAWMVAECYSSYFISSSPLIYAFVFSCFYGK